ncbi:MAG: bifunctional glutamate N-acetyltransferase/amino-acid acetyltransferase ArgJ [Thermodesulfobacteriota bacterium]|nr:bifunctional glutamate N-acetyltransferase/amino-acid acetyltransferase ArgJ [Thermodesulfobacteriota bacterium]
MKLTVKGFKAAAVKAGIRGKDRLDLGMIYSEVPAAAAAVFTTSSVKAAPVVLGAEKLKSGQAAQALVVNSSIANACTGAQGMELAGGVAGLAARSLDISENLVQVSSTGVIGEQLDFSCFEENMDRLVGELSEDNFMAVARAMMTTDTVEKTAFRRVEINGREVRLLGLAKGAGMIMPNMATMLCFVVTDAAVSADLLGLMLKKGADQSFNVITVDGDTSTNDTVLVMANGLAGNSLLTGMDQDGAGVFQTALDDLLKDLALQIVADGEGATKLITVRVNGALNRAEAEQAARTVANSALFKTACFGEDANWGRIIGALGRSGVDFDPERVDIGFDDVLMVREGLGLKENEEQATNVLKQKEFSVNIDLKNGSGSSEVYTCDFSLDYVRINADYRT